VSYNEMLFLHNTRKVNIVIIRKLSLPQTIDRLLLVYCICSKVLKPQMMRVLEPNNQEAVTDPSDYQTAAHNRYNYRKFEFC